LANGSSTSALPPSKTLLISDLFLVVDIADSAWSLEVEDKIIVDLKKFVG